MSKGLTGTSTLLFMTARICDCPIAVTGQQAAHNVALRFAPPAPGFVAAPSNFPDTVRLSCLNVIALGVFFFFFSHTHEATASLVYSVMTL